MAPYRYNEVNAIASQHPEAFPKGDQNDPARFRLLKDFIIPTLNLLDDGYWGLCTKTDQNDRIPVDILMWRPTRELIDCLTGTGASWLVFPLPTPDAWVWTAVQGPVPGTDTQYDEAEGLAFQQDVVAEYEKRDRTVNLANVVWSNRMVADAVVGGALGYTTSRAKHLQELIDELDKGRG